MRNNNNMVPSSCRPRTLRAPPRSRRFLRCTRARDSRPSSPQGRSSRVWRAAAPSWRHFCQETLKTTRNRGKTEVVGKGNCLYRWTSDTNAPVKIKEDSRAAGVLVNSYHRWIREISGRTPTQQHKCSCFPAGHALVKVSSESCWETRMRLKWGDRPEQRAADCIYPVWGIHEIHSLTKLIIGPDTPQAWNQNGQFYSKSFICAHYYCF